MAWIAPKLNWLSTDKINFADWNRIENDTQEVANYLNSIGYIMPSYALSFNGVNAYVDCGNSASLQLTLGTMEARVKTSGAGASYRDIIMKAFAFDLYLLDNILIFYSWGGTAGALSTGVNLADGLEHHVAASFQSGVVNGTNIYIDGVLVLTGTMIVQDQTQPFTIGGHATYNQNLNGLIREARLWNVIRTQAQIQASMNILLIGNEAGLIGYWKLSESTGLIAYDSTANSNNGTVVNAVHSGSGIANIVMNRNITSIDKLLSINRIEQNLEAIRTNFMTPPNYFGTRVWTVSSLFDYNDAIRLESDVNSLHNMGILIFNSFVYCGTQNSGNQELIW